MVSMQFIFRTLAGIAWMPAGINRMSTPNSPLRRNISRSWPRHRANSTCQAFTPHRYPKWLPPCGSTKRSTNWRCIYLTPYLHKMRFRLRTLLILLAVGPALFAPAVIELQRWRKWREWKASVDDPFLFESYFVWRRWEMLNESHRR